MIRPFRALIPALVVFAACFMALAWFNRVASDDFEFMYRFRELGFLESIRFFYDTWNTRWVAIGLMNLVWLGEGSVTSLLLYHFISLLLLWVAFMRLTVNFIAENKTAAILSGYLAVAFFYSCFNIADVFFWINTSTMYLYGSIAAIFGAAEVTGKRKGIIPYLILLIAGIYAGASYEPLAFVLLIAGVAYAFYTYSKRTATRPQFLKLLIFLLAVCTAFAISYAGEGHHIRAGFLPQTTITSKAFILTKALFKMYFIKLPAIALATLLFSMPWMLIGQMKKYEWMTTRLLKQVSGIFLILVFLSIGPVVWVMSEMGPKRAWTQIALYFTIYAAFLSCYAGVHSTLKISLTGITKFYAVIGVLYIAATFLPQIIKASAYANAYDARMELIMQQPENSTLVRLKPLPDSGWLHSAEISEDSTHFTNQHLKRNLNVPFNLIRDVKQE